MMPMTPIHAIQEMRCRVWMLEKRKSMIAATATMRTKTPAMEATTAMIMVCLEDELAEVDAVMGVAEEPAVEPAAKAVSVGVREAGTPAVELISRLWARWISVKLRNREDSMWEELTYRQCSQAKSGRCCRSLRRLRGRLCAVLEV